MIITSNYSTVINNFHQNSDYSTHHSNTHTENNFQDIMNVSKKGVEIQFAKGVLATVSPMREDLVKHYKDLIANEEYNVDIDAFVEKLIR